MRVQQAEVGIQLAPIVARELRADAVQRDVERAAVRLYDRKGAVSKAAC